jgi:hypothetical protein
MGFVGEKKAERAIGGFVIFSDHPCHFLHRYFFDVVPHRESQSPIAHANLIAQAQAEAVGLL